MASLKTAGIDSLQNAKSIFLARGLIPRDFVQTLITRLETNQELQTPIVLEGPNGIGKTFALQQILNWFKEKKEFLIIDVPSAVDWVMGRYPYQSVGDKWEQPYLATLVLKRILEKNQNVVDQFRSKNEHSLVNKSFSKGTPYSELLHFGSSTLEASGSIFKILFQEIQNEKNVLVGVDNINAFFSDSKYFDKASNKIHSAKFLLPQTVLELFHTKSYAKVVGATSKSITDYELCVSGIATEILPALSKDEIHTFSKMYRRSMLSFSDQDVSKLKILSGGNPRKLFDICRFPLEL